MAAADARFLLYLAHRILLSDATASSSTSSSSTTSRTETTEVSASKHHKDKQTNKQTNTHTAAIP